MGLIDKGRAHVDFDYLLGPVCSCAVCYFGIQMEEVEETQEAWPSCLSGEKRNLQLSFYFICMYVATSCGGR